ncbi:hypothetical protein BJ912DRAFT_1022865 [Pholiota molesta]|nr:hypothetical protein BJ912DRAFT_1022865 [Pholiota molesta]
MALFLLSSTFSLDMASEIYGALDEPPTYKQLRQWEMDLPQHNLDLPFPEGRHGKYVYFRNQVRKLGWNNVLNEVLMNTHLAYKSNRTYVYQDYMWKRSYYPWPWYKHHDWRPRTPLNALIGGPSAGGPWGKGDSAPRSVSERWFDIVCPESERRVIYSEDVKPAIKWEAGDVIFRHWQKLLSEAPERCIEIRPVSLKVDPFPQVFDLYVWGSERILPLWEDFKNSPVSRLLSTSPIVQSAIDRNSYLFMPRSSKTHNADVRDPFDRMLAIHLRRGDFSQACLDLANWNSTFYSWNLLPSLPDSFSTPPGYQWGKNTPANVQLYLERCFPTDEYILNKIRTSRADYIRGAKAGEPRVLDTLFLLTNDKTGWVDSMRPMLKREGWNTIVATKQLHLDQEQKDVNMAVDMEFARKAAVFVGNGWSSFTSNIVHRRLVDGREPITIRFF